MNDQEDAVVDTEQAVDELHGSLRDALDEPRRKKFHDEVTERVMGMTDLLVKDCPELRGLGVVFLWDVDLSAKD